MVSEQERQTGEANKSAPPKSKATIIRILGALKRSYHRQKRKTNKEETDHQRNERLIAHWTRRLGIFTIVLAFIAAITAAILYITDHTLRETLVASSRAWIAPRDLFLEEPLAIGKPLKLKLVYENSGKEPALNVTFNPSVEINKRIDMPDGSMRFNLGLNTTCDGLTPVDGNWSAYPGTTRTYEARFSSDDKTVFIEDVEQGRALVLVYSCFAYTTFGKPHYSAICYILQRRTNKVPIDWFWAFCPTGNKAD